MSEVNELKKTGHFLMSVTRACLDFEVQANMEFAANFRIKTRLFIIKYV